MPELREGVARHAGVFYGMDVDPERGVIVTAGATQGVYSAIMGLVDPGDEVIVIEPYYDSYVPGVIMAGGVPIYVPMHPPNWTFEEDELRAAFQRQYPRDHPQYAQQSVGPSVYPRRTAAIR